MVMNTVNASYTETYDLNTAIGELSMLAVHTPQAPSLKRMFHGFFENYKKYRINSCSIRMVCASQQALTPDLVGLEAGQVDPRDVLNPILFKACTGESINLLLDQIYNAADSELVSADNGSVGHHATTRASATAMYYQMLSDDTWRKEHPQRGLVVSGLKPMVHRVVTTQPFKWTGRQGNLATDARTLGVRSFPRVASSTVSETGVSTDAPVYGFGSPSGSFVGDASNPTVFVSNGLADMPWLETAVVRDVSVTGDEPGDEPVSVKAKLMINDVPRVYCGAIVLPPAILQRLFFRMQISWSVSFKDWRPAFEYGPLDSSSANFDPVAPFPGFQSDGTTNTYFNLYHNPTATSIDGSFGKELSSFTTTENTEVETVMEQGR